MYCLNRQTAIEYPKKIFVAKWLINYWHRLTKKCYGRFTLTDQLASRWAFIPELDLQYFYCGTLWREIKFQCKYENLWMEMSCWNISDKDTGRNLLTSKNSKIFSLNKYFDICFTLTFWTHSAHFLWDTKVNPMMPKIPKRKT